MSSNQVRLRYEPAQLVQAVDRARGDGRYFVVKALSELPIEQREDSLSQVLGKELRPDERQMALAELARLRPSMYLAPMIKTGLRSRSINVQQMVIASLPALVGNGLEPELGEQVEGWVRRRLANPRRGGTWAMWEIPGIALGLLPSYGTERVVALLTAIEPRMQQDERDMWQSLNRAVNDPEAFKKGLMEWMSVDSASASDPDLRDPTAEVSVDRVMKRLGYSPANPESHVYDSLVDFDVPMYIIDIDLDEPSMEQD